VFAAVARLFGGGGCKNVHEDRPAAWQVKQLEDPYKVTHLCFFFRQTSHALILDENLLAIK
jgi:hypothetical protein